MHSGSTIPAHVANHTVGQCLLRWSWKAPISARHTTILSSDRQQAVNARKCRPCCPPPHHATSKSPTIGQVPASPARAREQHTREHNTRKRRHEAQRILGAQEPAAVRASLSAPLKRAQPTVSARWRPTESWDAYRSWRCPPAGRSGRAAARPPSSARWDRHPLGGLVSVHSSSSVDADRQGPGGCG
jgi:hypothetical protein